MTQKEKVIEQLNKTGKVSRNWCLQNFISRLSAIALQLKKEGWNLKGQNIKTQWGNDYEYTVLKQKSLF